MKWYAVANDLVGGWSIASVDLPLSMMDRRTPGVGPIVICDFITDQADAEAIAELLSKANFRPRSRPA